MVQEGGDWQRPDWAAKRVAGVLQRRHPREPRGTVYELAA
jgi:hypothetical protein